jgi:hypothetical protein
VRGEGDVCDGNMGDGLLEENGRELDEMEEEGV